MPSSDQSSAMLRPAGDALPDSTGLAAGNWALIAVGGCCSAASDCFPAEATAGLLPGATDLLAAVPACTCDATGFP